MGIQSGMIDQGTGQHDVDMDKYLFPPNKIMKKYLQKQYENMGKNRSRLENVNYEGLRTQSMSLALR